MEEKTSIFLRTSTILFILNIVASALNYFCQLVMARVLSVESYGTINTIFSFMMIVAVPGTTLTMVVAKYLAGNNVNKSLYLKRQLRSVLLLTMGVFAVLLVFRNGLKAILSIQNKSVLVMAFVLAALGYFQPLYAGVFSGTKRFILVGIYSLFIPMYKLIAIGIAYLYSQNNVVRLYTVLAIMIIGVIVTAFFGQYKSTMIVRKENRCSENVAGRLYTVEDLNALILNISLMLYMNIDLLAVRYYGGETESGLYSSVLLFGRIVYYFATTLGTILLPSVASDLDTKEQKKVLKSTLFVMIGFAIICMLPINLLKVVFIRLLYGANYLTASKYMIFVSLISFSLSFYTVMVNYVVGVGKTRKATAIMIVIDVLLLCTVMLIKRVNIILGLIGFIGLVGACVIYIVNAKG